MEPIIILVATAWVTLLGVFASQEESKEPETLYRVEECDSKGKCVTIVEIKEGG